jgi:hypothetical protein
LLVAVLLGEQKTGQSVDELLRFVVPAGSDPPIAGQWWTEVEAAIAALVDRLPLRRAKEERDNVRGITAKVSARGASVTVDGRMLADSEAGSVTADATASVPGGRTDRFRRTRRRNYAPATCRDDAGMLPLIGLMANREGPPDVGRRALADRLRVDPQFGIAT